MCQLNNSSGHITSLASEGQGIIRQDGFVTFIPFTAPGDYITYQTTKRKKNFAVGSLLSIQEPSPERIEPQCKYFGTCGGCQLQHIHYRTQLEYKRKWIEDALKKIGKFQDMIVPEVTPATLQWNYRRRVNLLLRHHNDSFTAGYIATDNTSLLQIDSCPIFVDENDPIIKAVQNIVRQLKSSDPCDGKITILKAEKGYIIHFHFRSMPDNANEILSAAFQNYPFINGILATSQKHSIEFGTIETSCEINGLRFHYHPKTFIQNHPEQSINIYNTIKKIAIEIQPKRILDLYCGIGISTLMLAKAGLTLEKIKGIEINPQSIALAKSNAKRNHLVAEFLTADVEKILDKTLKIDQPDFIIVNPPREGLSPQIIESLKSNPAKSLIYISCMPSTLARDLKSLCEQVYEISSVQGFDMFPQTVHVETVVLLKTKINMD